MRDQCAALATTTRLMAFSWRGRSHADGHVSSLCLGTNALGPQTTEPDDHAINDAASAAGISSVDTANVYGGRKREG